MTWEPINNLIRLGLSNRDGLKWEMQVSVYTDETRTSVRGGIIGRFINGKFVPEPTLKDGYSYKCVWTTDGNVIFFRKKR